MSGHRVEWVEPPDIAIDQTGHLWAIHAAYVVTSPPAHATSKGRSSMTGQTLAGAVPGPWPGDLLTPCRTHDLPPLWDGYPVEWEGWAPGPAF